MNRQKARQIRKAAETASLRKKAKRTGKSISEIRKPKHEAKKKNK